MIVEANTTALMVSHDRYFLDRVANSILCFEGDRRIVEYAGDYSTFVSLKQQREREQLRERKQQEVVSNAAEVAAKTKKAPATKLSFKERQELAEIEGRIDEAETEAQNIEEQLGDPALYAERADEVADLIKKRNALRDEVTALMPRWEVLASRAVHDEPTGKHRNESLNGPERG
jgi:ATP-binding cassette subfamily F protein uup